MKLLVDCDLRDHPKTLALARLLGKTYAEAVGYLVSLWAWAMKQCPSGKLDSVSDEAIAWCSGWFGNASDFVAALQTAGWLDVDRYIHDWEEHEGQYLARFAKERSRKRSWKQRRRGSRRLPDAEGDAEVDVYRTSTPPEPPRKERVHGPSTGRLPDAEVDVPEPSTGHHYHGETSTSASTNVTPTTPNDFGDPSLSAAYAEYVHSGGPDPRRLYEKHVRATIAANPELSLIDLVSWFNTNRGRKAWDVYAALVPPPERPPSKKTSDRSSDPTKKLRPLQSVTADEIQAGHMKCPDCDGSGFITKPKLIGSMQVKSTNPCQTCNFDGRIPYDPASRSPIPSSLPSPRAEQGTP